MPSTPELFVSGYTQEGSGAGPGVARFALAGDGIVGERLAESTAAVNPSFLADAGEVLLGVEELAGGNIVALDPGTLELAGRASSGGSDTCHVALIDGMVWAANYSSGTASATPLSALLDGTAPEPPELVSHPGSGPVTDRQGESHAHQVTATEWGTVLVSDLGADRVDEYSARTRVRLGSAELPPGTGPRHVVLKDQYLLVAGELDGHLHVLQRALLSRSGDAAQAASTVQAAEDQDEGGHFWRWLFKVPLAETAADIDAAAEFYPSHIELSADGNLLYAAVRGADTIVVLDVSPIPGTRLMRRIAGAPRFLASVPCGGRWPRHFALSPAAAGANKLYVANQLSNNVAVFDLDEHGLPAAEPVQSVEFGSPACILLR